MDACNSYIESCYVLLDQRVETLRWGGNDLMWPDDIKRLTLTKSRTSTKTQVGDTLNK